MNAKSITSHLPRVAFAAVVLATATAFADTAPHAAPSPPRVAVLAGSDVSQTAVLTAGEQASSFAAVRHVGGLQEARAEASTLAAQGYDRVLTVGAQARAAGAEAATSAPSTRFVAAR
jgi:hypothetical protein